MQWLHSSIAQFQVVIPDSNDGFEHVYSRVGKRTKIVVAFVLVSLIDLGWIFAQNFAFEKSERAIIRYTTLAHRDQSKQLCIYTDASD